MPTMCYTSVCFVLECSWQQSSTIDSCDLNQNLGKALWKEGNSAGPDSIRIWAPPQRGRMKSSCCERLAWNLSAMLYQLKNNLAFLSMNLEVPFHSHRNTTVLDYKCNNKVCFLICNCPPLFALSYRSCFPSFSHCLFHLVLTLLSERVFQLRGPIGVCCACYLICFFLPCSRISVTWFHQVTISLPSRAAALVAGEL